MGPNTGPDRRFMLSVKRMKMKKIVRIVVQISAGLLLVFAIMISIVLHRDNSALRRALCEQRYGALSPDLRRLIVADLESSDPERIAAWKSYFKHTLDVESNLGLRNPKLSDLLRLYRTREMPARSNYFGDVVACLAVRQQFGGLKKGELLAYLGKPDKAYNAGDDEVLEYFFYSYGRESVASARITNDVVVDLGFNVGQHSSVNDAGH